MSDSPGTMNAVVIAEFGGPDVLRMGKAPRPIPRDNEILIEVEAAGVNRPDVLQRQGHYPPPPGAPDIPGLEVAGRVAARGPGATDYEIGEQVLALVPGGGYAQFCLAHQSNALPIPSGISMVEAGAIPETYFTVWVNVFQRGGLKAGENRRDAPAAAEPLEEHHFQIGAAGLYHLRYRTLASDGETSISDWYESDAKRAYDYRVVAIEHGVRVERGRLSGHAWQQDANGLVLPESASPTVFDRVLEAAVNGPDRRVRLLGITKALPQRYVLQIAPNSRIVRRMYFDASTMRLREIVTQDYDNTVTTIRFFDYIWLGRRLIPTRESSVSDLSSKSYESTLLRHERIPYESALLAIPRSKTPFVAQASLPATVNSLFSKDGILVRADIQGAPYWLKLDSGSSDIVLDRDLAVRLGLYEFGRASASKGGKLEEATAVLPRMDVGPLYATNLVVRTFPSEELEDRVHVVGLLGCDFIAGGPLAIDFHKQTVTAITAPPPASDSQWTSLRTPLRGCRPVIDARLDGRPARLLLDFGSPSTVINEDIFKSIAAAPPPLDTKILRFIGGEPLVGTEYALARASAGGLDLAPLVVTVVDGGRAQDLDNDGFIGRNVLDNYQVVLDYQQQRTYFRK